MIWRGLLLVAVFAVFAAFAAPHQQSLAQSSATPRGTLLIVGGGPQPPALVQQFVDLAGGRGKARIVVFAEASEDGWKSSAEPGPRRPFTLATVPAR